MKLKSKKYIIEVEQHTNGLWCITKSDYTFFPVGEIFHIEELKKHFTPVDCEAVEIFK